MSLSVVIDTNVFVAARFNPSSVAREIVRRIPRLEWGRFEQLFDERARFVAPVPADRHRHIDGVGVTR